MSPLHKLLDRFLPPTGHHRGARAIRVPKRIEVPLAGLASLPPQRFPDVPHGAVAAQAFRPCSPCGGDVAVVLHPKGAHRCGAGHITITSTTRGNS